ncbi:hypothetical protein SAMN05421831_11254 [Allopseudospirillum japonicum]|uniref:NfeD integral membrane domain-containing protein n=1 Tax=Allopseudospirillum japonicum TaxID=64971 RepID=A0A1H6U1B9_9GAMM|nr:NfeD family protein [Allopseudospirillum japonicum]SEI84294.1 hypothetical protein SAMN05421831_11254 [Allopseudospirillum japonicum]
MTFQWLYWHWLVLGIILMMAEIFIPTFTLLGLGIGAVAASLALAYWPELPLAWQLILWACTSAAVIFAWVFWVKPKIGIRTQAGDARAALIGQHGQVVSLPKDHVHGRLRFHLPILGDDEWDFICEDTVILGDKLLVVEINGNTLIAQKEK